MRTYVAFLRGVNLGPHRAVAMPRLVELGRGLGYQDVWTWANSGNLVLSTTNDAADVERELASALEQEYGTRVDVTVRSATGLAELLDRNPFPEGSPSRVTIAFLSGPPQAGAADRLAEVATDAEPFEVDGREVWVHYGNGLANSRLAAGFSRVVGVSSTTRTLGTVSRIVTKIGVRARPDPRSSASAGIPDAGRCVENGIIRYTGETSVSPTIPSVSRNSHASGGEHDRYRTCAPRRPRVGRPPGR